MFLLGALLPGCPETRVERPDILLISIDTLRADALGCYGSTRGASPVLDELAANGVRFTHCFATAPNTAPSHMSVMTSLYPTAHAVPNAATAEVAAGRKLPEATTTLAEILREHGYQTVGFADGGNVGDAYGFDRGFDRYRSFNQGVEEKVDQALSWADRKRDPKRPFFLFLHTYEVHAPYLPPRPWIDRFARPYDGWLKEICFDREGRVRQDAGADFNRMFDEPERIGPEDAEFLRDLYHAGVAYTDRELGRLFEGLVERGLDQNLLVVVISDHGEEFGEHGAYGHKQLYDEVAHVPLILNGPMLRPRKREVEDQVSLVDVLPTILDLAGIDPPEQAEGRSLKAAFEEGVSLEGRPAFGELIGPDPGPILAMVREPEWKLTRFVKPYGRRTRDREPPPEWRLFHLASDPREELDVLRRRPDDFERLRPVLLEWIERNLRLRDRYGAHVVEGAGTPAEELRQLGY